MTIDSSHSDWLRVGNETPARLERPSSRLFIEILVGKDLAFYLAAKLARSNPGPRPSLPLHHFLVDSLSENEANTEES